MNDSPPSLLLHSFHLFSFLLSDETMSLILGIILPRLAPVTIYFSTLQEIERACKFLFFPLLDKNKIEKYRNLSSLFDRAVQIYCLNK
jgi:hypothetical protein